MARSPQPPWPTKRTPEPTCGCRYQWKNYGYLHGVNMGDGWVRMDTNPDCAEHSGLTGGGTDG